MHIVSDSLLTCRGSSKREELSVCCSVWSIKHGRLPWRIGTCHRRFGLSGQVFLSEVLLVDRGRTVCRVEDTAFGRSDRVCNVVLLFEVNSKNVPVDPFASVLDHDGLLDLFF